MLRNLSALASCSVLHISCFIITIVFVGILYLTVAAGLSLNRCIVILCTAVSLALTAGTAAVSSKAALTLTSSVSVSSEAALAAAIVAIAAKAALATVITIAAKTTLALASSVPVSSKAALGRDCRGYHDCH